MGGASSIMHKISQSALLRNQTICHRHSFTSTMLIRRNFSLLIKSDLLLQRNRFGTAFVQNRRAFTGFATRFIVRNVLKIRYWIAGGAIGGGVALGNRYEEWKQSLPDLSWIRISSQSSLDQLKSRWSSSNLSWSPVDQLRLHDLSNRLKTMLGSEYIVQGLDASLMLFSADSSSTSSSSALGKEADSLASHFDNDHNLSSDLIDEEAAVDDLKESNSLAEMTESQRLQNLQDEMLETQSKYQRELERVEKDNKNLRQQLMLKDLQALKRHRKIKRSLIDMYSEALDLLNDYDSSYNTTDNLPRVVVVGDQSSGKTSVLEMVAQARIFPRGSGQMMTRAPVKVTLVEGPYRTAQFKDSAREFDLDKETDLRQLRREIETRMRNSVADGRTVSNDVIALTVRGPALPRMVLVDLPGVISTVTTDMAKDTKDDIVKICRQYMENPNAIILCIQDGSVDAERSNVTDLVRNVDPDGRRTILVLTKVDLAEENLSNPNRIRKILAGDLFPMKALGYYAVVTGKGATQDSIETIRQHELDFFANSKLFRDGVLKPTQMTTRNMSLAVSDCFWRMVKDSVESQADAFRATRFNLETEWKNTFPRIRQLDRDEMFDKAKGDILDEMVNLSQISAAQWEATLEARLWDKVSHHVLDQIYMPASLVDNAGTFNTMVDIRLKHWADKELAATCVRVGWETLVELMNKNSSTTTSDNDNLSRRDPLLQGLKDAVLKEAMHQHRWEEKAMDYLRVIQLNALEDRVVPDKTCWDGALVFMDSAVNAKLVTITRQLDELTGPHWYDRWFRWKSPSDQHTIAQALIGQFSRLLRNHPNHRPSLTDDDVTVVLRSLEADGIDAVPNEMLKSVWKLVYKTNFLKEAQQSSRECENFFYHYQKGFAESEVDCQSVVLFWRVQKMLNLTCNALRQQITNTEQRRLETEIKNVLDDWFQENDKKRELLTGRRVDLAEELKQVKHIQERLEEFITALGHDNKS